jgi:DUF4097 and DUF4098 domain-containing protein YvlB
MSANFLSLRAPPCKEEADVNIKKEEEEDVKIKLEDGDDDDDDDDENDEHGDTAVELRSIMKVEIEYNHLHLRNAVGLTLSKALLTPHPQSSCA